MKKLALLLALALMLTFTCAALADSISVAVVYSDTVDDKGWCQSMDTGIKNAIARGYEIDYTPVESVAIPDAPNTLDQLADNYDIIIVHGAQFTSACTEVAAEYPEQVFAIGTSDKILGDNIFTYMPMSEEPGYINGVIAALTTKAKKVGIVGPTDGGDSARFIRGFVKALQDTDPTVEYMLSWTGSFSDTVGAGDIGKTFIEAGCDVLVGPSQQAVGALRNVDAAEGVRTLGSHILHTHAKDGKIYKFMGGEEVYGIFCDGGIEDLQKLGDYFEEVPLGEGDVNWDGYIKALDEVGYQGYFTIERECGADPAADIRLAVAFLRKLLG